MEKIARIGVGVMMLKDNKIILGKRNEGNALGGDSWTCPGGKLEFGENIIDAAKREVEEETGIKVNEIKLISVSNDIAYGNHFVTLGFLCNGFEGQPKVTEPNKIIEWKWFPINKLPKPIFLPSEKLINNYKEGKIYKGD
jgi:mutator protein MutT